MSTHFDFRNISARSRLIRKISAEGCVLLKNDGALLPLSKETPIALFGRTQIDTINGGTGSANASGSAYKINILDGLRGAGFALYQPLAAAYERWVHQNPVPDYGIWGSGMHAHPEMPISDALLSDAAAAAQTAVLVLGRVAGENEDVQLMQGDFFLSDEEEALLSAVSEHFQHLAVVLNTAGLIDLSFLDRYKVDALLYMGMPGLEAGAALSDVLCGAVNPGGKLTDTAAFTYEDYPCAGHFGQSGGGLLQDYVEDIYVGYRYFTSFEGAAERVRFPFGFGLCYTEFAFSDIRFSPHGDAVEVSLHVCNTGARPGREVVQLYARCPQPQDGGGVRLYKPHAVLAAFKKTAELAPGASETVVLTVQKRALASFDDTGVTGHPDAFVLEAGDYAFFVGNSVSDALSRPAGTFSLQETQVVEQCCHLDTALPRRLRGDGSMETLQVPPVDPARGIFIGETANLDAALTAHGENPGALLPGQAVEYRLIFSAAGRYDLSLSLTAAPDNANAPLISAQIGDLAAPCTDAVYRDGILTFRNLTFPGGPALLRLEAKTAIGIQSLSLRKCMAAGRVFETQETVLAATDFTDCAYGVNCASYADVNGQTGGYLEKMQAPGRFVNYKLSVQTPGIYDLRFCYSNARERCLLNDVLSIFVSNVGQRVEDIAFEKTCSPGLFCFETSAPVRISLPGGDCFLKILAADRNIPDFSALLLRRSEDQRVLAQGSSMHKTEFSIEDFSAEDYTVQVQPQTTPRGIQLSEVYRGTASLADFVAQLSDGELANLVSGTPQNRIASGTTGTTTPLYDRGVVAVQTADGPLGLRLHDKTLAFPGASVLACTWDKQLAYEMGAAMAWEALDHGVDCILAPALNIHRDVRCGRNFEYYSEDPLLSGTIAAAVVHGMQAQGVSAMPKHFCANSTEHERLKSNSRVSARALREIYLAAFRLVVQTAAPHAIMSSYNSLNGRKVCETYELITTVARGEWGFDGIFVTDWLNDSNHVRELAAGHDLKMSTGDPDAVCAALRDGTLTRKQVETCAARVLKFVMRSDYFLKQIGAKK